MARLAGADRNGGQGSDVNYGYTSQHKSKIGPGQCSPKLEIKQGGRGEVLSTLTGGESWRSSRPGSREGCAGLLGASDRRGVLLRI